MSDDWKINLMPYTYPGIEEVEVEVDDPVNPGKKMWKIEKRKIDIERTTDKIKVDLAEILGNSGITKRLEYWVSGREGHKRNKVGDKIEACEDTEVLLDNDEYQMLLKSADELCGALTRDYKELLNKIYDAEKVSDT